MDFYINVDLQVTKIVALNKDEIHYCTAQVQKYILVKNSNQSVAKKHASTFTSSVSLWYCIIMHRSTVISTESHFALYMDLEK